MKYTVLPILFGLFLIVGCKQKAVEIPNDPWSALTIESEDHTLITVFPDKNTVTVKVYHSGTFFYRPKKITVDTLRFSFAKAERDSIFSLVREIIATPPLVKHHCTDFVGDLRLKIYYGETCVQAIDYTGVCNWNILSNKTMVLHNILKRRLNNVFLGEDDAGRSHVDN